MPKELSSFPHGDINEMAPSFTSPHSSHPGELLQLWEAHASGRQHSCTKKNLKDRYPLGKSSSQTALRAWNEKNFSKWKGCYRHYLSSLQKRHSRCWISQIPSIHLEILSHFQCIKRWLLAYVYWTLASRLAVDAKISSYCTEKASCSSSLSLRNQIWRGTCVPRANSQLGMQSQVGCWMPKQNDNHKPGPNPTKRW